MTHEPIQILDTTLRDGKKSLGPTVGIQEQIDIALHIERLGVNILEAGFVLSEENGFESVNMIAQSINHATICALAKPLEESINAAAKAIAPAKSQRIHLFMPISPMHLEHKLHMTTSQALTHAIKSIQYAKSFCHDVEFSCQDATRSDKGFLKELIDGVIHAGATVVSLPDTVGYALPFEYGAFIKEMADVMNQRAVLSTHCHNDLGLAVANSIAAITNGARQVECTMNGIGPRAGNAALEEIVSTLYARRDLLPFSMDIDLNALYATSQCISTYSNTVPSVHKPIIGANAFPQESGFKQGEALKYDQSFEVLSELEIGKSGS